MMEYELRMPGPAVEAWSDALFEAGALSVTVEDADSQTPDELAVYGEPGVAPAQASWKNNRVLVLFDAQTPFGSLVDSITRALGGPRPAVLAQRSVQDRDWVQQTQSQFPPVQIGRIWIVPSWHQPPDPAACNIRIDPGAAFGTGTHPTTRLCLAWMEQHLTPGCSVLDYGCGSGVLSICAALLGAARVVGVDIDPQAVSTAQANAARNGVSARYTAPDGLNALPPGSFDLVVANILANPIVLLAPNLLRHLAPAGTLLLSGVLDRQADEVIGAYRALDPELPLRVAGLDEGWVALGARRKA